MHAQRRPERKRGSGKHEKSRAVLNRTLAQVNFIRSLASFTPTVRNGEIDTSPSAQTFPLMELPAELRVTIYEYLFSKGRPIVLRQQERHGLHFGPSLLVVSKQVREEALPVYFKCNTFSMRFYLDCSRRAARWMELLAAHCGKKPFGAFNFDILDRRWNSFNQVWPLVQILAKGTVKLDLGSIKGERSPIVPGCARHDSLFRMAIPQGSLYIQQALEECALMARRARKKGWTRQRLNWKFDALRDRKFQVQELSEKNRRRRRRRERDGQQ
ncbi:hypothetical protein LTR37_018097 [Vermiconidia calcicola]|uniref:Uncharacterized protein n=1 Tax=Vermiconidia calcicola TaxID=1690605 RepID=A0ACC3MID0_9PEZI|nr:hypothetical protein LTR37_018097 [Vermiconidia calcicola]